VSDTQHLAEGSRGDRDVRPAQTRSGQLVATRATGRGASYLRMSTLAEGRIENARRGRTGVGGSGPHAVASYRCCVERIETSWPTFATRRRQRFRQGLFDSPVEKVAENIIEDL
jgi:hypothetical protein